MRLIALLQNPAHLLNNFLIMLQAIENSTDETTEDKLSEDDSYKASEDEPNKSTEDQTDATTGDEPNTAAKEETNQANESEDESNQGADCKDKSYSAILALVKKKVNHYSTAEHEAAAANSTPDHEAKADEPATDADQEAVIQRLGMS